MAIGGLGRQWSVWKAAWQAESGRPPNTAVPAGPTAEFLPEALDLQPMPPSPIGRALLWTMLIAFLTAVAWTMLVRIDSVTTAHGRVVASGNSKIIHPPEAGVIAAIYVQDGQVVKQGHVLIELDSTRGPATQDATNVAQKSGVQQLLSPIDGVVQQLAVHSVGSEVTPTQPLLTVVPLSRSLEVEAQLEYRDVRMVQKGQPVGIKPDMLQMGSYGTIPGHVLQVSGDPTSIEQGGRLSPIRVRLDRSAIQTGSTKVNLIPEMVVTVEIKTGQRRMIEYLLEPVRQAMNERVGEWNALVHAVRGFIERRNLS
jgi:multidrug efflux pump subunit AcrA (membrane-fusion protein)